MFNRGKGLIEGFPVDKHVNQGPIFGARNLSHVESVWIKRFGLESHLSFERWCWTFWRSSIMFYPFFSWILFWWMNSHIFLFQNTTANVRSWIRSWIPWGFLSTGWLGSSQKLKLILSFHVQPLTLSTTCSSSLTMSEKNRSLRRLSGKLNEMWNWRTGGEI